MIYIDNEENMALNQEVGQQTDPDTTPVAEPETAEEGEISVEDQPQDEPESAGKQGNKGYQNRIRELNAKAKAAEERARSLEERLAETTNPVGFEIPPMNFNNPIVKPGEEIDPQEFERRVLERAHASTQLQIKRSEAVNRINAEATEMTRVFPELDPESDSFNPELSESVAEATDAYIRNNPYDANVKQFVTKLMKPYKAATEREVGKATENIARQVSQAALRPNSVKQPENTAGEKSIAELEAELGMVNS